MSFLGEIKRRKVFQAAAVYAVVAWLIVQVVDVVLPAFGAPPWVLQVIIFLLALGFPVALILSWAFELTAEGVVRDDGSSQPRPGTGRRLELVLAFFLVIAVAWIGFHEINPPAADAALPNSVAVLPFENLSIDPENAFFAAGIHDTILHELAKIADMNVIARTSVLPYGDGLTPIPQIADELNVETVMEGTVQYAGDQVRITAQLIDPGTGAHLWSGNYDRAFADLFAIQSEIAERIAMALEAELLPSELALIDRAPTNSPEAYAAYLKAIEIWPGLTESGISFSQFEPFTSLLDEALSFDPQFALAYAHKGKVTGAEEARRSVERALELDPDLGFGHLVLAVQLRREGEISEAELAFDRALELNPNNPEILTEYAQFKLMIGQPAEIDELSERITALDPHNWGAHFSMGEIQRWLGDHAAAAEAFRKSAELSPTNTATHVETALDEAARGNTSAAQDQLRLAEQLGTRSRGYGAARQAHAYKLSGLDADASRLYAAYQAELAAFLESTIPPLPDLAAAYASLAIRDEQGLIEALENLAERENVEFLVRAFELGINAYDDPMLDEPAFSDLRRRLRYRE